MERAGMHGISNFALYHDVMRVDKWLPSYIEPVLKKKSKIIFESFKKSRQKILCRL
jgi:hypothetical protein